MQKIYYIFRREVPEGSETNLEKEEARIVRTAEIIPVHKHRDSAFLRSRPDRKGPSQRLLKLDINIHYKSGGIGMCSLPPLEEDKAMSFMKDFGINQFYQHEFLKGKNILAYMNGGGRVVGISAPYSK